MKRVLIVEDQADIRKLIRMTLEFEPYEIHEAADGTEGLRLADEVAPDLILLDVMMPGELDGLQVCARVRANPALRDTRVVLLTARGQNQDRDAGGVAALFDIDAVATTHIHHALVEGFDRRVKVFDSAFLA